MMKSSHGLLSDPKQNWVHVHFMAHCTSVGLLWLVLGAKPIKLQSGKSRNQTLSHIEKIDGVAAQKSQCPLCRLFQCDLVLLHADSLQAHPLLAGKKASFQAEPILTGCCQALHLGTWCQASLQRLGPWLTIGMDWKSD